MLQLLLYRLDSIDCLFHAIPSVPEGKARAISTERLQCVLNHAASYVKVVLGCTHARLGCVHHLHAGGLGFALACVRMRTLTPPCSRSAAYTASDQHMQGYFSMPRIYPV